VKNYINGKSQESLSGQFTDLINPTTGEVFGKAALSDEKDIDLAYNAAAKAFETWKETTQNLWALGAFLAAHVLASVSITKSNLIPI